MIKNWRIDTNRFKNLPYPLRQLKEDSRRDETVLHIDLKEFVECKDVYDEANNKFYVEPTENENNNIDVNINKTFHEKLGISPFMTNKKYITLTDYFIQDKLLIKRFKISC